jgi:hypothetical protein
LPCSCHALAMFLPCYCHVVMFLPWSCHGLAMFLVYYCRALAMFLPRSCCAMLLPRLGSNYAVSAKNLPLRAPCGAQQTCDAEPCDAARARRTTQSPARHQWQDAPNNYYFGPHCGDATHTHHQQHKHTHTHTTNTRNKHTHTHTHAHTHAHASKIMARARQEHGNIMARSWQGHGKNIHGKSMAIPYGKSMAR